MSVTYWAAAAHLPDGLALDVTLYVVGLNIGKWLNNAGPAAFRLDHEGALDPALKPHDQLSQLNVLVQIEHLMSYPIVREREASGALHLSGWWFDIENGDVYVYEPESRSFEVIDRQHADRLIARFAAKRS